MRILITGGHGFIGSAAARHFSLRGAVVRISSRNCIDANVVGGIECCKVNNLSASNDWSRILTGVDAIVHCAGLAHVLSDSSLDPAKSFSVVNRDGTLNLARQAAAQGVKRFIFLSSIGVNGVSSAPNKPFSEMDVPKPHNEYARSKLEAEIGLFDIAKTTSMEVVIIRPPLVYGNSAPGNFSLLIRAIRSRVPLPFGAVKNLRSMIFVENLTDFIFETFINPRAANQLFLVSDKQDMTVSEIIRNLSMAMKLQPLLVSVPIGMLRGVGRFVGAHDMLERLCSNLQIDSSKAEQLLEWTPPYTSAAGFIHSVQNKV